MHEEHTHGRVARPRQPWVQGPWHNPRSTPGPCRGPGATAPGCHVYVITVTCRQESGKQSLGDREEERDWFCGLDSKRVATVGGRAEGAPLGASPGALPRDLSPPSPIPALCAITSTIHTVSLSMWIKIMAALESLCEHIWEARGDLSLCAHVRDSHHRQLWAQCWGPRTLRWAEGQRP